MRVTVDSVVLADFGVTSVSNFKIGGQRMVQSADFLRAIERQYYDRGCRSTLVTFHVSREHASAAAAALFCLQHDDRVPAVGMVSFTMKDDNNVTSGMRFPSPAAVTGVTSSFEGATSFHDYTISGGRLRSA